MKAKRASVPVPPRRPGQRGAVLLISLIILAVLLAAGAALVRSFDTSLFQAGNLAFRRDLVNHAGRVTPDVQAFFTGTGALSGVAARAANRPAANYSATMLPSNAQGIPTLLLQPAATFDASPAVTLTNRIDVEVNGVDQQVRIRYLIDRMCLSTGDETTLGDRCVGVDYVEEGGSVPPPGGPRQISYRVSIRVDGPRDTQAFFQTTLSL